MNLSHGWAAACRRLQQSLFPPRCRLCMGTGEPGLDLCRPCRAELPWLPRACPRCALPLPEGAAHSLCAHCQNTPPHLDGCRALFLYRPPVDRWIQDLKFHQDLSAARLFGTLLAQNPRLPAPSAALALLPVPLHAKRLAQRGYNQALEIARPLKRLGYQLDARCCRRSRHTDAQSALSAAKRNSNVRGAFSAAVPLQGRHFILIDDVLTTGATLNEVARTLRRAGAESVTAWVLARAV